VAEMRVTVDGEERSGRMHDVIVALGPYLGGGMKMCPDADPSDGKFDVLLIGNLDKRDLVLTLPKIYRGTHLPHPKAEILRGATVTIDADEPIPVRSGTKRRGVRPSPDGAHPRQPARGSPPTRRGAGLDHRSAGRRLRRGGRHRRSAWRSSGRGR